MSCLAVVVLFGALANGSPSQIGVEQVSGLERFALTFFHNFPRTAGGSNVVPQINLRFPAQSQDVTNAYAAGLGVALGIPFVLMMMSCLGCLFFCLSRCLCNTCGQRKPTRHYTSAERKHVQIALLVLLICLTVLVVLEVVVSAKINAGIPDAFDAGDSVTNYFFALTPFLAELIDAGQANAGGVSTVTAALGLLGAGIFGDGPPISARKACLDDLDTIASEFRLVEEGLLSLNATLFAGANQSHLAAVQAMAARTPAPFSNLSGLAALAAAVNTPMQAFTGNTSVLGGDLVRTSFVLNFGVPGLANGFSFKAVAANATWSAPLTSLRGRFSGAGLLPSSSAAGASLATVDAATAAFTNLTALAAEVLAPITTVGARDALEAKLLTLKAQIDGLLPTTNGLPGQLNTLAADRDGLLPACGALQPSLAELEIMLLNLASIPATATAVAQLNSIALQVASALAGSTQAPLEKAVLDTLPVRTAVAGLTSAFGPAATGLVAANQLLAHLPALGAVLPGVACGQEQMDYLQALNDTLVVLSLGNTLDARGAVVQATVQTALLQGRFANLSAALPPFPAFLAANPVVDTFDALFHARHLADVAGPLAAAGPVFAAVRSGFNPRVADLARETGTFAALSSAFGPALSALATRQAAVTPLCTAATALPVAAAQPGATLLAIELTQASADLAAALSQLTPDPAPPLTLANSNALAATLTAVSDAVAAFAGPALKAALAQFDGLTAAFTTAEDAPPSLSSAQNALAAPTVSVAQIANDMPRFAFALADRTTLAALVAPVPSNAAAGNVARLVAADQANRLTQWPTAASLTPTYAAACVARTAQVEDVLGVVTGVNGIADIAPEAVAAVQGELDQLAALPSAAANVPNLVNAANAAETTAELAALSANITDFRFAFVRYRNQFELELRGWDTFRHASLVVLLVLLLLALPITLLISCLTNHTGMSMIMGLFYVFCMYFCFGYSAALTPVAALLSDGCSELDATFATQAAGVVVFSNTSLPSSIGMTGLSLSGEEFSAHLLCQAPSPYLARLFQYPDRANQSAFDFAPLNAALAGLTVSPLFTQAQVSSSAPPQELLDSMAFFRNFTECAHFKEAAFFPLFNAMCGQLGGALALNVLVTFLLGLCLGPGAYLGIIGYKRLKKDRLLEFKLLLQHDADADGDVELDAKHQKPKK